MYLNHALENTFNSICFPLRTKTITMDHWTIFWVFLMATIGFSRCTSLSSGASPNSFDVMKYGAAGNGATDDSSAFLKAWTEVCRGRKSNNPTFVVPARKSFLLNGPVTFEGPCDSPSIHVQVLGNIVGPRNPWRSGDRQKWIVFSGVNGLVVDGNGNGRIDGLGSEWWRSCPVASQKCARPTALAFSACKNLRISGVNHINSQKNHISISGCENVTISNIKMSAPDESPNTDGINISGSTNVQISDSFIGTGDDCIAINGGSSKINITGITCGPGHGISIGSLGKSGATETVEDVDVKDCIFNSTTNGVRIKTWQGGSGYARRISFHNITLISARNPIIIDQFYCPDKNCRKKSSAVKISEVRFSEFRGTSMKEEAITVNCSQVIGCTGITLDRINITSAVPDKTTFSTCTNARGRYTRSIPKVDCLLK